MAEAPPDATLVAAARRGDRRAFAELVARHETSVRRLAARLVGDPVEAEDVVSEALLRAYLGLEELRRPESFGGWLCGIAVNLARMRLRALARARRRTYLAREPRLSRDDGWESLDELRAIREALEPLPPGQRSAVLLRDIAGLSTLEVAAVLGASPAAIRVRLHRAHERLRSDLAHLRPQSPAEEEAMIPAEIDQVLVQMLDETPGAESAGPTRIVVLREGGGQRLLPIWIGAAEAEALAMQLAADLPSRPMPPDLTARLLHAVGAGVERVAIASLRGDTFYAVVRVRSGARCEDVDARPSDALNLAARVAAPVVVEEEVMANASIVIDPAAEASEALAGELARRHDAFARSRDDVRPMRGSWRRLTPELVRALAAGGA